MNPIIAIIHNVALNTFHPALFLESPMPGGQHGTTIIRHKSKMHHTTGFDSRDEAVQNITQDFIPKATQHFGEPLLALTVDVGWDGDGIPAMVVFFVSVEGQLIPT